MVVPCCRRARTAWQYFHNNITQYELYRTSSTRASYVDDLLKNMATLPVVDVDEMVKKGTQIKLILTLSDHTTMLFKPMRYTVVYVALESLILFTPATKREKRCSRVRL